MPNLNSSISPELEQALSTVVDKRSYQNALKALEISEGEKEVVKARLQESRVRCAYLSAQKIKLEKEIEQLKAEPVSIQPAPSRIVRRRPR